MRALIALLLSLWLAPAWAQLPMTGAGKGTPTAVYSGPGNAVGSAKVWWGLRAYSLATAGTKSISLCDDAGANCSDVLTNSVTGALANPGTRGSNDCSTSGTCRIQTFYDQSGASSCSGVCDATQATNGSRAVLVWNCINSKPCARFSGGQGYASGNLASNITQPHTFSAVVTRTANFTTAQLVLMINNTQLNFRALANAVQMFGGTGGVFITNITDSNWHALQGTYNGASSVLFCGGSAGTNCSNGGTSNSLSPGTNTINSGNTFQIGQNSGANFLSGDFAEGGVWALDFTASSRQSDMNANQIAYWGPF